MTEFAKDDDGNELTRLYLAYDANGTLRGSGTKRAIKKAGLIAEIYVGHVRRDSLQDGWHERPDGAFAT